MVIACVALASLCRVRKYQLSFLARSNASMPHSSLSLQHVHGSAMATQITTLDVVRADKFVHEMTGSPMSDIQVPVIGYLAAGRVHPNQIHVCPFLCVEEHDYITRPE